MAKPLDTRTRRHLISTLEHLDSFATESARRNTLIDLDLKKFVPRIDLSGAAGMAIGTILTSLQNAGYINDDTTALGLFLEGLIVLDIVGEEEKRQFRTIIVEFDLKVPLPETPQASQWQGKETSQQIYERVIAEDNLKPISYFEQGLFVARSVAYVGFPGGWGSGFMVSPSLFVTNNHVIQSAQQLSRIIFRFNYQNNFSGELSKVTEYKAKLGGFFHSNPKEALDYTIIELDGEPGRQWGWLNLKSRSVKAKDRATIIQHPLGQPKQISFQNNFIEYVDERLVQYVTTTKPGSSGSPVFNDDWQVVALHHSFVKNDGTDDPKSYFRNEGIRVNAILNDLPENLRNELTTGA